MFFYRYFSFKYVVFSKAHLISLYILLIFSWPEGKYCIYKKGPQCPYGLESGFVIWDDENKDNQDTAGGDLPEGVYGEDTKIFFCCSTTGDWEDPIKLPTDKPFYLFAFESNKCQKVKIGSHVAMGPFYILGRLHESRISYPLLPTL